MLSDLENMDVMLGSSHFERDLDGSNSPNIHSESSNFEAQQPEGLNTNGNSNENEIRSYAGNGNLADENYGQSLNYLTGEMNTMIAREVGNLMETVNSQMQRAINSAIVEQVLPQIQASLRTVSEAGAQRGKVPAKEKPELGTEGALHSNNKRSSKNDLFNNAEYDSEQDEDHYTFSRCFFPFLSATPFR